MEKNDLRGRYPHQGRGDNEIEIALYDELLGNPYLQHCFLSETTHRSILSSGSALSQSSKIGLPTFGNGLDTMQPEHHVNTGEISDSKLRNRGENSNMESTMGLESGDFLTQILRKLRNTEEREKLLRKQISEVIVENESLRKENCEFRALCHAGVTNIDEISRLREDNTYYKNQVDEMVNFLRDYGLEWVGCSGHNEDQIGRANEDPDEMRHLQCYHSFVSKIEELNLIMRCEPAQIRTDLGRRRGKFVHNSEVCEKLSIAYFRNGLLVQSGPFRYVGMVWFH